jgi:hypothetical protein
MIPEAHRSSLRRASGGRPLIDPCQDSVQLGHGFLYVFGLDDERRGQQEEAAPGQEV